MLEQPWHLSDWEKNQATIVQKFLGVMYDYTQIAHSMLPPLPVTADLPFWLHTIPAEVDLVGSLLTVLDGATFMTYRNTPDALMDIGGPAFQMASRYPHKSIDVAVETCPSGEGRHITYHGFGRERLDTDLTIIERHKLPMSERHRIGIAVHDYHNWAAMD
jgi:hypothetical protein